MKGEIKVKQTGESKEEGEYKLKFNPVGFLLPGGLLLGGLFLYFFTHVTLFGLVLITLGVFSFIPMMVPLIQLKATKTALEEEEKAIKIERMRDELEKMKQEEDKKK